MKKRIYLLWITVAVLLSFLSLQKANPPHFLRSVEAQCKPQCPVYPSPENCYLDENGKCKRKTLKLEKVSEPCELVWGFCPWGCFHDVDGRCKREPTKKVVVPEDCEMICMQ